MTTHARKAIGNECTMATSDAGVRVAEPADREFVISLAPQLVASGLPPWRDPRRMLAAYIEVINSILQMEGLQSRPQLMQSRQERVQRHKQRADATLLIAEDEHAVPLGFILLVAAMDCYTHARCGHVAQLVVADARHEFAAGLALTAAAETWARSQGGRLLTLSEFWANHPARAVCDHADSSRRS